MDMALVGVGAGSCLHSQRPQLLLRRSAHQRQLGRARRIRVAVRARALSDIAEASQVVQSTPDLTWQIWAGAIAGVTPFVVAGIEFSKRIAAQQRCSTCNGSGLVKKGGSYFRCGNCGESSLSHSEALTNCQNRIPMS
uniref:Viral late gene transcription factor 3 zinc ribbon domain-containing protein n=1 Tax=Physcomitrium patens TaxID=3218 RepID=A0A7I4BK88_PHYPA